MTASFQYNIDVVGTCNLRCPSCPVGNMREAVTATGLMSLELFGRILDKIAAERVAPDISIALYDWGEPTLHPKLPAMIEMIRDRGFRSQISSNLNVDKSLREIVKSAPDQFIVSTSGWSNATYQRTHAGGDANLVKSNLYKLRYYADTYKVATSFVVYYLLYKHNQGTEQDSMRALAAELGFGFEPFMAFLYPLEKNIAHIRGQGAPADEPLVDLLLMTPRERATLQRQLVADNPALGADCGHVSRKLSIRFDGSVPLCCTVFDRAYTVAPSFLELDHAALQERRTSHELCRTCMKGGLHLSVRFN